MSNVINSLEKLYYGNTIRVIGPSPSISVTPFISPLGLILEFDLNQSGAAAVSTTGLVHLTTTLVKSADTLGEAIITVPEGTTVKVEWYDFAWAHYSRAWSSPNFTVRQRITSNSGADPLKLEYNEELAFIEESNPCQILPENELFFQDFSLEFLFDWTVGLRKLDWSCTRNAFPSTSVGCPGNLSYKTGKFRVLILGIYTFEGIVFDLNAYAPLSYITNLEQVEPFPSNPTVTNGILFANVANTVNTVPTDWIQPWTTTTTFFVEYSGFKYAENKQFRMSNGASFRYMTYPPALTVVNDGELLTFVRLRANGTNTTRLYYRNGGTSTGTTTGYYVDLDTINNFVRLQKYNASFTQVTLVSAAMTLTTDIHYFIRARFVGGVHKVKVWADGSPEPATWTIGNADDVTDSEFLTGFAGIGFLQQGGKEFDFLTWNLTGGTAENPYE